MSEYTKVWLPDFSNLQKEQTDQEKRVEARKQQARLESGIITANDRQNYLIKANKVRAQKEIEQALKYRQEEAVIQNEGRPLFGNLSPIQLFVAYGAPGYSTLTFTDDASKDYRLMKSAIKHRLIAPALGHAIKIPADIAMGAASLMPFAGPVVEKINNIRLAISGPDGNIFHSQIILHPDHFYRVVGKDAILDAKLSGLIRGNPLTGDGPYFLYDGNPQRRLLRAPVTKVNHRLIVEKRFVIEGYPSSADNWVDSWRASSRRKSGYIKNQMLSSLLDGDDSGYAFWSELYDLPIKDIRRPIIENPEAIPYLNDNKQTLLEFGTEAFPMINGKFEAPAKNFVYYEEYPLFGWRRRHFMSGGKLNYTKFYK